MKKNNTRFLLLGFLLCLFLSACANPYFSTESQPHAGDAVESASPVQSQEGAQEITENDNALSAFKAVLAGEKTFFNVDTEQELDIFRLRETITSADVAVGIKQFAVIDLDGDDVSELVLWLAMEDGHNDQAGFIVLRYQVEGVYGYTFPYRGFYDLKEDGTFYWSGGESSWGIRSISFTGNTCELNDLAHCQAKDNEDVLYFINNESVTKEEFQSTTEEKEKTKDADWTLYDKNSIDQIGSNL